MNEEQPYVRPLSEYVDVIRRRKYWLLVPALVIIPLTIVIAFALPATFQSQATILIEEQAVSQDIVQSTSNHAAQRVQVISQRVMALENISKIINEFGLYEQSRASESAAGSRLGGKFRQNVELDMVSADVVDERGRPTEATIAFTLAFSDSDPAVAQQVTAELVRLFLEEDLRERTEQASDAADFLDSEAQRIRSELLRLEQKLAEFKAANEGNLPEFYQRNLVNLESARRELTDVEFRAQELQTRRFELNSKKSQISPSAPVYTSTGDVVMSDVDRLKALQSEYRRKVALYKDNHPDLIRLDREIKTLQSELGVGADAEDLREQLSEQKQYLAELQTRYNDSHQEVVSARRVIQQLEETISRSGSRAVESQEPIADNPAYILLQGELFAVESELRTLTGRAQELRRVVGQYEQMIAKAPAVEQEYKALLRDHDNASEEYKEIKTKQRGAIVARNLEQRQKGESFVLVEPPVVPQDPVSPNRPSIILIGIFLAGALGFGLAVVREVTDGAIHGIRELTSMMGEAPLGAIPYIENKADISSRHRKLALSFAAAASLSVASYYLIYTLMQ